MKKFQSILAIITLFALAAQSQTQFIRVIENAGKYRFERIDVREGVDFNDTLIVDRFPGEWLDSAGLETYQRQYIDALAERQDAQRQVFRSISDEIGVHLAIYDQMHGEGAFLNFQKERLLAEIQGNWKLTDKNTETTRTDITISANDFRKNASKFGAITVTDELKILVTGYFAFNLEFSVSNNGTLRASRGERTFVLKKE